MASKIELPRTWQWDGKKLKPKIGASSSNSFEFDGKVFKPCSGEYSSNS